MRATCSASACAVMRMHTCAYLSKSSDKLAGCAATRVSVAAFIVGTNVLLRIELERLLIRRPKLYVRYDHILADVLQRLGVREQTLCVHTLAHLDEHGDARCDQTVEFRLLAQCGQ